MAKDSDKHVDRDEDGLTNEERKTLEQLEREAKTLAEQGYAIDVDDEADPVGRGVQIVGALDQEKDAQGGLSEAITKKYVDRGQGLIRDSVTTHLDPSLRRRVSPILGGDPGDVRIHTGEKAQKAADAMGARAFAMGSDDIYFGRGEYAPNSAEGLGVLVHELTHTMDENVGAALSQSGADAVGSQAEKEAEEKEAVAVDMAKGGGADSGASAPANPDFRRLSTEVVKLMKDGQGRRSQRTGGSS